MTFLYVYDRSGLESQESSSHYTYVSSRCGILNQGPIRLQRDTLAQRKNMFRISPRHDSG